MRGQRNIKLGTLHIYCVSDEHPTRNVRERQAFSQQRKR